MLTELGYGNLPVCIAKTQYSFSDNAKLLAAPTGFRMNVREVRLSAGAGFVVVICGNIMTMPGLPKKPAAENIDVTDNDMGAKIHNRYRAWNNPEVICTSRKSEGNVVTETYRINATKATLTMTYETMTDKLTKVTESIRRC